MISRELRWQWGVILAVRDWFARPLPCKLGQHDTRRTIDLDSDSADSTLRLSCVRIGCNYSTPGWAFKKKVANVR